MVSEKPVTESSNIVTDGMIQKHPSERGGRRQRYVVLYSCCCCCCCCLHSIGGAIGVLAAGGFEPIQSSAESKPGLSIQGLYWTSFLITILLGAVGFAVYCEINPNFVRRGGGLVSNLGVSLLLFGPIWLLAAGIVSAFRLRIRKDLPDAEKCWKKLGQIVAMSILGSIIGGIILYVLFVGAS